MDTPVDLPVNERRSVGLGAANGLYLLVLILVAVGGSLIQSVSVAWGLLVTEIVLIFLPAYLYLRKRKLPVVETVRWRWPGGGVALLAVLTGLSLYPFAAYLSTVLFQVTGYSEEIYAGIVPQNLLDGILMFIGMAILAPLCEEFLFRGVIQPAYQARGSRFAILFVGVMFAFFHLSFLRFIGILPFALVLGWMYWRSDSLVTSILLHASYNFLAPLVLLAALLVPNAASESTLDASSLAPVGFVGLFFAVLWLYFFWRKTAAPAPALEKAPFGWRQAWPLIPAALVILFFAIAEMYIAINPDLLEQEQPAEAPLSLSTPGWEPAAWQYQIRNRADEIIGQADCQRTHDTAYQLTCIFDHQQSYQIQLGSSYYQDGVHQEHLLVVWEADTLNLREWQSDLQGEGFATHAAFSTEGAGGSLQVQSADLDEMLLDVPEAALLPFEWAWRLSALDFKAGQAYAVERVFPLRWSQEQQRSLPQIEELILQVTGPEVVSTPAGEFSAWKVTLGDESAWYAVDAPHDLIQYDDGMNLYQVASFQD